MDNKKQEITDLEQLLDRIDETIQDEDRVTLRKIVEAVGSRSFGSILLVPGLVMIVPGLGDIPGVTTANAVVVLLIAVQMLFRKKHLWLPNWLLECTVKSQKISKAIGWFRKPARFIDRLIRERLTFFNSAIAIAIGCTAVALIMPLLEVVPFGGIVAGIALTAFGLALVANDGLLALLAFIATAITLGAAVYHLL